MDQMEEPPLPQQPQQLPHINPAQLAQLMQAVREQVILDLQPQLPQPQRARGPDPKPATPPFYHGAHKGSEAETWLFQLENYFRLLAQRYPEQLADDYKISYAVSLLRDTAAQWWMLRTKTNSGEQAIHSFEGFKAALSKKFVPVNAKEQAREKLAYLTQTGDLQVYVEQFENLSLQIDDLSAAEGMDKFCRGLKPEHQIWVKTYGVSTLEEAVNLAHKVSAFSSASQRMSPPPYRAPIDAMDIDVMHMNALTGRSPKDKRELYHEHVQELVSFPPVHDRPLTPGPQRPQRDYQSPSRQGNHPSPGRQGNYPSYGRQDNYPSQSRQGNYPSPGRQGNYPSPGRQGQYPGSSRQEYFPNSSRQGNGNGDGTALPPLTPEGREYLRANGGCFRCREIGHWTTECPYNNNNSGGYGRDNRRG